jgi:hypothetical protein
VYPVSLIGEEKRLISPISAAIVNPVNPADPWGAHQQRDVAMIRSGATQPSLDLTAPPLEIVDQLKARLDVPAPRLGEIQLGEQPAAGDAEQVRHRDPIPEHGSTTNAPGSSASRGA